MEAVASHPHILCEAIQNNCNISDARHASDYTLCVYLLKMREFFRWERGYRFSDALPQNEVGKWLTAREKLWDDLEAHAYEPLSLYGRTIDPFDADAVNEVLLPQGYVYSAGVGPKAATHFFMGKLFRRDVYENCTVLISDEECARDIAALPAMCIDRTIFVRRESLKRMLWEAFSEWQWNRSPGLLAKAFGFYGFDNDLEDALETMCDAETDTLVLHEIGELNVGAAINRGNPKISWQEMLANMPRSRAELSVRAVKDLLADTLHTLPELIKRQRTASLYFYLAHLPPLHKHIFPALTSAAQRWADDDELGELQALLEPAAKHWLAVAREILEQFNDGANDSELVTLIENKRLL